jgi:nitrogen fixation/metabolism regulation signal transduction histidine kinase
MTQQLSDARSAVERSLMQLDAARGNLQTILDNLTAGVIVLNARGIIQSSNPGATRILKVPLAAHEKAAFLSLPNLQNFAAGVQEQFELLSADKDRHELDHWQKSFEIHASGQGLEATSVTLVARGAILPDGMRLLVFDDISEIVSAQRSQAWGEVARRLAHEIKNPLTPIQLSAERLERKLDGKLEEAEQTVLSKSVKTIVEQVAAMKRLVNEFRDYARLPSADLKPLDLNNLILDVMGLYVQEPSETATRAQIFTDLDPTLPLIEGDAQQLRQVVHNLLQNAQDASEVQSHVMLVTRWSPARKRVKMTVLDEGPGFSPNILQRAFEPYVTTKAKGTGLGLAVVKKIADEHGARLDIANRVEEGVVKGAQVSLSFSVEKIAQT